MHILILGLLAAGLTAPEVTLPKPETSGGMPVLTALAKRQSGRSFSGRPLPEQMLSNLLWAADGVNRPATGYRTAPSARNRQEIDLYVVMEKGSWRYDAKAHKLVPAADGDLRKLAGTQDFVATAPLNLVYVEDTDKSGTGPDAAVWAGVAVGAISQNVYLFCASEGLSTVVRGSVDRTALAKALGLKANQKIVLAQTVGFGR